MFGLMSLTNVNIHVSITPIEMDNICVASKSFLMSLCSQSIALSQTTDNLICFVSLWFLPFSECHINVIIFYVAFEVLTSFT